MLRIFFFSDAIFLISSLGGCGEININDRYLSASASFLSAFLPPFLFPWLLHIPSTSSQICRWPEVQPGYAEAGATRWR